MPKPQWLIDKEQEKEVLSDPIKCPTCDLCKYFGKPVKLVRHKGKTWTEVFECAKHPGCFNTKYSICCDDFVLK